MTERVYQVVFSVPLGTAHEHVVRHVVGTSFLDVTTRAIVREREPNTHLVSVTCLGYVDREP